MGKRDIHNRRYVRQGYALLGGGSKTGKGECGRIALVEKVLLEQNLEEMSHVDIGAEGTAPGWGAGVFREQQGDQCVWSSRRDETGQRGKSRAVVRTWTEMGAPGSGGSSQPSG